MSEQQQPFVEHESTSDETAKLPIIKLQNNRPNSHFHASTPHISQEEQVSTLQPTLLDQLYITNGIYDPEIDENFAPTLKISALKKGQSPLSERQPPLVLSPLEQEPSAAVAASSASLAQQLNTVIPIADDYDFSEIDVDIIDVISYSVLQPNKELSIAEQEILIAASSLPSAEYEAVPLTSTASSSPVQDSPPLIERQVSVPLGEEIFTSESEIQILIYEEIPIPDTVTHDEEKIASSSINESSVEIPFIAPSAPDTIDAEAPIDDEAAEVESDVQTHIEDQPPPVEQEVLSVTFDATASIEQNTSEEAENITDDTATVSIEQEATSPITSSLPLEENKQEEAPTEEVTELPNTLSAAPADENLTEEAQDERLSDTLDSTTTSATSPPELVDDSLLTEQPLLETIDASLPADTSVEEALSDASVDTPLTLQEEHVETEQVAGVEEPANEQPIALEVAVSTEEGEHVTGEAEIADEQSVVVEALPIVKEPVEAIVDKQPVVVEASPSAKEAIEAIAETQPVAVEKVPGAKGLIGDSVGVSPYAETANVVVKPASVKVIPISPALKRSTSETQVIAGQRKKYRLSRREIANLILLTLFVVSTILLWSDLTATHVYLNALDPNNGKVLTQQDLGGYQDTVTLTAPRSESSQVYVGIHGNDPRGTQQIMALSNNTNSWSTTAQFAAPLARGALSGTADGHLFAVSANGLQVMTANGHMLWSLQGEQPSQGTHHYQPISDSQTLYAVASLKQPQVGAYDLQHGTRRWIQTLDDTLYDAPPFLLDENTLYVASDHQLYALNSSDGSLRWKKAYPSRTLLMENEGEMRLLLAASTQGLTAFNPTTGALVWSFNGQPDDTFTSAQFYQATIASSSETNSNVIYTTGIVWQMPQVQEQIWLYAVNAATGRLLWSQQVGVGFISADAGRTLLPLIDRTHKTVVLQQQLDNHEQRITAFDSNTGASRWSTLITDIAGSSPTLAQTPNGTLILFTTVANSRKVLLTPSLVRVIEIVIFVLMGIGLLFMAVNWLRTGFSYLQYNTQFRKTVRTLQHYTRSPLQGFALLPPPFRTLVILLLLSILGGAGTLGYTQLNQFHNTLYQVNASNGAIQWQQRMTTPAQAITTDAEGSVITTSVGDHLQQLQAFTPDGTMRWKTFTSQGIFSATAIVSSPGTIVVELRGDTLPAYQFAPADDAYPDTISHLLVLYVLNRSTGTPLWQHVLVYPDEQQDAVILGADSNYIYVSSTQARPASESKDATLQLIAVNRTTGTIDWHVFGPAEPNSGPHDDGRLLLRKGQAIWQVAGTVYAIDTVVGQIEWRRQIIDDDLSVLIQENQMTEASGTLLVIRRHGVHALDLSNGNELWTLPSKGASTPRSAAGVAVAGQTILVYGNGQIEAFNLYDHHSLWRNLEFEAIQHLSVSADGKTVYLIEVTNLAKSSPALVALDAQTGTTQWTFEPGSHATFPLASPDSFLLRNNMLFVTTCFPFGQSFPFGQDACAHQRLYGLTIETGKPAWTFTGHRISDLHLSEDGKLLLFNVNTSLWSDLI